jgi:hypothetical protein
MRMMAAAKLKQVRASSSQQNPAAKRQACLITDINNKLVKEDAIITQADKGRTCVILHTNEYNEKVLDFLTHNGFHRITKDPTNKYKKQITKALQNSNLIIHKNQVKHLTQKKPKPPALNSRIKLHKPGNPIRPVVNNTYAPAYKISKFLARKLNDYIQLMNGYNVKNSITLANDLVKMKLHENCKMITFDIKDLYVTYPLAKLLISQKPSYQNTTTNT